MDAYTDRSPTSLREIQWRWVSSDNDQVRWGLFSPRTSPTYVEREMCRVLRENISKPDSVTAGAVYHEAPSLLPAPAPLPAPTAAPTRPAAVPAAAPTAAPKPAAPAANTAANPAATTPPAAKPAATVLPSAPKEQTCTLSFRGQQLWIRVTGSSAQAVCREFNLSSSAFFDGDVALVVQCSTTIEGQRVEFMGSGARTLANVRTSVYASEFAAIAPRCAAGA
jgi:hypothetical protein